MSDPGPVRAFDYILLILEDPEPEPPKPKKRKRRPWKRRKR